MPFYHLYELNHAAMAPFRALADMTRLYFQNPLNPLTHTSYGRSIAAGCEVLERTTRRYGKPEFGLKETTVSGMRVPVREVSVWSRPFCDLIHFERGVTSHRNDPKILIVAPMSGHYATLLRGTVEALMPNADVYITERDRCHVRGKRRHQGPRRGQGFGPARACRRQRVLCCGAER
ncbi:hypothetical protein LAB1_36950 [Roseibium sp. LAB1]